MATTDYGSFTWPSAPAGSNASVGLDNTTAPTSATEIGTIDSGGLLQGVSASNPVPVTGTVTATNPSIGTTGAAVPTSATYVGVDRGGNLVGLTEGQYAMASSLPVA